MSEQAPHYDLDAIRALDDDRLMQFCTLLEDWGERVALAWLAMCWRNEGIEGKNRNAASGSDPTDGTCNVVQLGQGTKRSRACATPISQTPWPRSRRAVH